MIKESKYCNDVTKKHTNRQFDLNKYTSNSSKGCAVEVDLEYPQKN